MYQFVINNSFQKCYSVLSIIEKGNLTSCHVRLDSNEYKP